MDEDQILARIDSALIRVEAALKPASNSPRPAYAELAARHETLRAAVRGALIQIDDLLAELGGNDLCGSGRIAPDGAPAGE